jgi:hypothetical protein
MRALARRFVQPALLGAFLLLAAVRLAWLYRNTGGVPGWDYRIYAEAVGRAAGGNDPYRLGEIGTGFINHPGLLLLVYPFQRLGAAGFWLWMAGSLIAWPLTLTIAAREFPAGRLPVLLLPLTAAVEGLFMGQASIAAGLCLAGAFIALRRERDDLAGLLIGFGVLFKLSLAIFGLYFLLKKRFRAVAVLGLVIAFFSAVSELLLLSGINGIFFETMIGLYADFRPGTNNASLAGFPYFPVIALILLAGLCAAVVREPGRVTGWRAYGGLAAWTLLSSPLTWHHHFVLLAVPLVGSLAADPGGTGGSHGPGSPPGPGDPAGRSYGVALAVLIQVDLLGQLVGLSFHTGIAAAIGVLILAVAPLTHKPNAVILSNDVR